jgi:hypothetical protein
MRKAKTSKSDGAAKAESEAKAKVKVLLESVLAVHLYGAAHLKNALSQLDEASEFLLGEFADVVDWNPAISLDDQFHASEAAKQVFYLYEAWQFESIDYFLHVQTQLRRRAIHRRSLEEERERFERRWIREVEAA